MVGVRAKWAQRIETRRRLVNTVQSSEIVGINLSEGLRALRNDVASPHNFVQCLKADKKRNNTAQLDSEF